MDFILPLVLILVLIIANHLSVKHTPTKSVPTDNAADLALYRYNKYQYLQSPEWSTKRKATLKAADYKCQMCNSATDLHVHHTTYKSLYREKPEHLVALCSHCHTLVHNKYGYPKSLKDYEDFYGPPIKLY